MYLFYNLSQEIPRELCFRCLGGSQAFLRILTFLPKIWWGNLGNFNAVAPCTVFHAIAWIYMV